MRCPAPAPRRILALLLVAIVLQTDSGSAAEWDRRPRPTAEPVSAASLFPWGADFTTPRNEGLTAETVHFPTPHGTKLRGWFFAGHQARQSILFCMGNSGNISLMLPYARILQDGGFDVLLFDYSGYGQSEGVASVITLLDDTRAAYDFLLAKTERSPADIGVFGVSLGSIPALTVAADRQPGAVVLEDVFIPQHEIERWLPRRQELPLMEQVALKSLETLILPAVDPRRNASRLNCPLFLMHGVDDKLLAPEGTLTVAESAACPTRVWLMPNTGHAPESLDINDHEYADQLLTFLRQAFSGRMELLSVSVTSEPAESHHLVTARLRATTAELRDAGRTGRRDEPVRAVSRTHVSELRDDHARARVPVEITFADRSGQFHSERRLLTVGDQFQIRLPFAPTESYAIQACHAAPQNATFWKPDFSDYSQALAELQERFTRIFRDPAHARMFTEDRGRYFYDPRLQNRLPLLDEQAVQMVLHELEDPEEVPPRLRPRYARLLGRLQCWPEERCGIPPQDRTLECAELMLKYWPDDCQRYYELGNARLDLGFADSAVSDALYRLARARLNEGRVQEAQELLRQHVQVLPRNVPTSLTEGRIQSIRRSADLETSTQR